MTATASVASGRRRRTRRRTRPFSVVAPLPFASVALVLLLTLSRPSDGALPTASLDLYRENAAVSTLHLSVARFGPVLPMGPRLGVRPNPSSLSYGGGTLAVPPSDDELLCNEADGIANYTNATSLYYGDGEDVTVLVPRGGCTFERKVLSAQRLGASSVVVHNSLSSRYHLNVSNFTNLTTDEEFRDPTYEDILWPRSRHDYDCSYARADVPKELLSFDPLPYNGAVNDPVLTGSAEEGNACAANNDADKGGPSAFASSSSRCPSQRCLLTGKEDEERGTMEACCAWDIHMDMNGDPSLAGEGAEHVVIPSLFASMAQGAILNEALTDAGTANTASVGTTDGPSAIMYTRWYPSPNASSFLLWMLGTFVTWIASYLSANTTRKVRKRAERAVAEGRLVFRRAAPRGRVNEEEDTVASEADAEDEEAAAQNEEGGNGEEGDENEDDEGAVRLRGGGPDEDEDEESGALADVNLAEEEEKRRIASSLGGASAVAPEGNFEDEPEEEQGGVDAAGWDLEARPADPGPPPPAAASGAEPQEEQRNGQQQQQQGEQQPQQAQRQSSSPPPPPQEHLELNAYHVIGFIIFASVALFVLFFFKIYTVVRVMYGLGCSGAMAQVVFVPLYGYSARAIDWIGMKTGKGAGTTSGSKTRAEDFVRKSVFPRFHWCGCDELTRLDVFALLSGYAVGISWLWVSFNFVDPSSEVPFYWIAQDVMGASICVAFLGVIRLNSVKIATLLLVAAFIYDIFFVFITPLIFNGDSIMITVATSGGPPDADPDFCEKYPTEPECQGGDPLPMLLTVPRINDYRGGFNLLGLGDIVLPGLLMSFGARLDAAGKLVELCTSAASGAGPTERTRRWSLRSLLCGSYLTSLTLAYAIGLLGANVAVHLMKHGQPALLYLVPACLGTMVAVGKVRGELRELWRGPKVLKRSDRLEGQLRHVRGRRGASPPSSTAAGGQAPNGASQPSGLEMTRT